MPMNIGMTDDERREWAKRAWKDIKDNVIKLYNCPRHSFETTHTPDFNPLNHKYRCHRCGGHMDLICIGYYIKGYVAAGGRADDIFEGWGAIKHTSPNSPSTPATKAK